MLTITPAPPSTLSARPSLPGMPADEWKRSRVPHKGEQQRDKGQHEGSGPGRQEQIPEPFFSNLEDSQQQAPSHLQ